MARHPQAAPDPNFYVFLAFGQSNMDGQAPDASQDDAIDSRFKVLSPEASCSFTDATTSGKRTQGQWSPAIAPIVRCDTHLGPLDWFGRTLADSLPLADTIGVVPVAIDGTAITGFDPSTGASYYTSNPGYMLNEADEYPNGNPYAQLLAMAKVAQQTGVIKGILLHQGETDAYNSAWATEVDKIYTSLLSSLGLSAANVPLLAGEVAPTGSSSGANPTIDALPKTISTAHVISSAGLAIGTYSGAQNVHFSADSYRTLGARYAQEMYSLLPKGTSVEPGAHVGIPGLRVESSAQGLVILSDVAFDRVSLVSVRGDEVGLGSGKEVRILPGQLRPGVNFLRARSGDMQEVRKILVER
ncbi:MAG TPA: sialate O-acetylesterase [Fibrobacteria bacterium]|nr:sialate O-acetylesterase [Fibrobacteria bacterium]